MALSAVHRTFLADHAVDPKVAAAAGVHSTDKPAPGLVFPWHGIDGRIAEQFRPDNPGDGPKYLWPAGEPLVLDVMPAMQERARDMTLELVIVEGTKQHLAAASYEKRRAVVGMVGCYGWSQEGGAQLPDLSQMIDAGRPVVVMMDADIGINLDVWEAADRLGDVVRALGGEPRFTRIPGAETTGLDDMLAAVERQRRPKTLERILSAASPKLPRRPARRRSKLPEDIYFHPENGLLVERLATDAIEQLCVRVDAEGIVLWSPDRGRYERDPGGHAPAIRLLPQRYRMQHGEAVKRHLLDRCRNEGRVIPELVDDPIINLPNGLLDLTDLTLHPFSPDFLSTVQLAVPWDPTATCPLYDAWIAEMVESQVDDLHEAIGQLYDQTKRPTKAVFCYGPSRSGKSTLLHLVEAVVGKRNVSSVTLHDLSGEDRFAAANLHGKVANIAADLSARDLRDLSTFKAMTGDDSVHVNRKYGQQFTLASQALLLFSANDVPPVSETSSAYLERMKPFEFPNSFAGHEDHSIELAMLNELPGIQRRWIEGLHRWWERGGYGPSDPDVFADFRQRSDRVALWAAEETVRLEMMTPVAQWTSGPVLYEAFNRWVHANRGAELGRNSFYQRLHASGVRQSRSDKAKTVFDVRLRRATDPDASDRSKQPWLHARFEKEDGEHTCEREVEVKGQEVETPLGPLVFDLETADADALWSYGPAFERIVGRVNSDLAGPAVVDTDIASFVALAAAGATLVAHNGFRFDFVALAAHHGFDLLEAGEAGRVLDTRVLAMLADPPPSKMKENQIEALYELDALSSRLGGPGKVGDLRKLRKEFGGYDRIPVDDQRYLDYCAADVAATVHAFGQLPVDDYARREHRLFGRLVSSISVIGFRVDEGLLAVRLAEQDERVAERTARVVARYGIPTTKVDGKPAKAPLQTKEGKERVAAAFAELGIDDLPSTPTGQPNLGKDVMHILLDQVTDDIDIIDLASTVLALNGETAAYGTVARWTATGRVHPRVEAKQASGRLSLTRPGMTILGKRDGRFEQRDVLIADPGCVLFAVDLSQIDSRAIAALSGDEGYAEIFRSGRDLHTEVAIAVFGDAARREESKKISHGWPYGLGIDRFAEWVGMDLALAWDTGMREQYPRLCTWMDEIRSLAGTGELMDNGFGRMMRPTPAHAYTQGPALMGQGCARDLMMEGVLRLPLEVVPMLRAIVHDEVVICAPEARAPEVRELVVDALSFSWAPPDGAGLEVPIVAEATGFGGRWGDLYRKGGKT